MAKYDYLIVGAGLFGSVFARELAKKNKKILIIDKNNHIGGICYSEKRHNIEVHHYGPHIFNTSNEIIWKYINKFASFNRYTHTPKVSYNGKLYSFPINLMTLYQLWGVTTPYDAKEKLESKKIKINNPSNLEEYLLSQVGEEIYTIFYKNYTTKQWGRSPKDLPASIVKRIPIRLEFNENYYYSTYQGIPDRGYTDIFNKLLYNIDIELGVDYFDNREKYNSLANKIVFTGLIDKFFDYKFGKLEYRSVTLKHIELPGIASSQGNALINYTDNQPYTRITEHKFFVFDRPQNDTIISPEYSSEYEEGKNTPSYPINDEKNNEIYKKYLEKSKNLTNFIFGGRLAEYKYYNMDDTILSALNKAKKEK